jgi:hypothetical protein
MGKGGRPKMGRPNMMATGTEKMLRQAEKNVAKGQKLAIKDDNERRALVRALATRNKRPRI